MILLIVKERLLKLVGPATSPRVCVAPRFKTSVGWQTEAVIP